MEKNKYSSAPKDIAEAILTSERIEDFLHPPEKLVKKEKEIKITLNLNKSSIEFFKVKAQKTGVPYQKIIKKVLDVYANRYS